MAASVTKTLYRPQLDALVQRAGAKHNRNLPGGGLLYHAATGGIWIKATLIGPSQYDVLVVQGKCPC